MTLSSINAAIRRFYWKRVRRHRYEICGSVNRLSPAYEVIRRYGCGRPIGPVWTASTGLWNYIVTGQDQTVYTVRAGSAGDPRVMERAEGAGGILCLVCFDRACQDRGVHRYWSDSDL